MRSHWPMPCPAGDGYLAQSALLWNPQGRLCALNHQSVVVFG